MFKSPKFWISVSVICLVVFYLFGIYNTAIRYENQLDAVYKDNQNILSNAYYGPLEAAGLGEQKYKDMMLDIVTATSQGYKGATGGKAIMLWLGQTYPNLSSELQMKFVSIGEKGLAQFGASQTKLLSIGQKYNDFLETRPGGFFANFMGFPKKLNLKEILTPVTDASTQESFKTKQRSPIK